jgi:multidrug efflux system membrane fusion protein
VIFTLAQDTIPQFIKKFREGVALPVRAYNRNSTELLATGTLTTIDNQIDPTTGTVKLRATFPNKDEVLFPNQFVNIKLIVDSLKNVAIAPLAGVQIGAPGPYVYVANPDSTISVRAVKLGPSEGERASVLTGLTPGDKVVVDGLDRLRDGAKIRIAGPDRAAPHDAASEKATPAKAAPEKVAREKTAPEKPTADKAAPDGATPNTAAPGNAAKPNGGGEPKPRPGSKSKRERLSP